MENDLATKKRKAPPKYFKNFEQSKQSLKACGISLILYLMKNVLSKTDVLGVYMDEMLHSIFFLGYIFKDCLKPEDFFNNVLVEQNLKTMFPEPFKKYNSDLPTRTPFSILLDMMEILYSTEERIKEELLHLLNKMKFPNPLHTPGSKSEEYYTLESTVICVCSDSDSQKYYGASLCCRKGASKPILIGLSCLKTWHDYVSHAVMSFSLKAPPDGITFPKSLRCQAYTRNRNLNKYIKKKPCLNCKDLFNLQDADLDKPEHPYGNCAETECLSKLLNNNQNMHKNAVINNHTEENLEKLRSSTKEKLKGELYKVGIKNDSFLFYKPSEPSQINIVNINIEELITVWNYYLLKCQEHG